MPRFLFALALLFPAALAPLGAQIYTIQPRPLQVDNKPRGGFSLSFRSGASSSVTFEDVGTIPSALPLDDPLLQTTRFYDDGFIDADTRGGSDSGVIGDDGRTNRWSYLYDSQVTPEGDISFHNYSTASNGTDVLADTGSMTGVDMQYDMVLGVFGSQVTDRAWAFTWGGMVGGAFSGVNASYRGEITANLVTVTDTYSLEGAAVPEAPYEAPSSAVVIEGTDSAGNPVSYVVDTTVLIGNRPARREGPFITPDGATVNGFWQVKGGLYTFRVGPWIRWQLGRFLSVRASAGASYTFVGVKMEHDEQSTELETFRPLRTGAITRPDKNERYGYFGALDLEWWISDRTGFFAGVTVEDSGEDVILQSDAASGARRAVVELPNGTGFRAGISVLF